MAYESNFQKNQKFELPGKSRKRRRTKANPAKLDHLVDSMMSELKGVQVNPSIILVNNWEEVVGEELFHHTKFASLNNLGMLHIYVLDSAREIMVRWQSDEIQKNASRLLKIGDLKSIKITINNSVF